MIEYVGFMSTQGMSEKEIEQLKIEHELEEARREAFFMELNESGIGRRLEKTTAIREEDKNLLDKLEKKYNYEYTAIVQAIFEVLKADNYTTEWSTKYKTSGSPFKSKRVSFELCQLGSAFKVCKGLKQKDINKVIRIACFYLRMLDANGFLGSENDPIKAELVNNNGRYFVDSLDFKKEMKK